MKKTLMFIFTIIITLPLLTGCNKRMHVTRHLLVHELGIDFKEDEYIVKAQVYKPQSSGGNTPLDPSTTHINVLEGKGRSVLEAIRNIELSAGKQLFMGHNELIVLGKGVWEERIEDILQYFVHDSSTYPGIELAVTEGEIDDIVNAEILSWLTPSESLKESLSMCLELGYTISSNLLDITNNSLNETNTIILPVIEIIENNDNKDEGGSKEENDTKSPISKISHSIIIKDSKFQAKLSNEETVALNLITKKLNETELTIPFENTDITLNIKKIKRTIEIKNDKPLIEVSVKGEISSILPIEDKKRLCEETEKYLSELCDKAIKVNRDAKSDIFDISRLLKKYETDFFSKNKNNLNEIVSDTEISITFDLKFITV